MREGNHFITTILSCITYSMITYSSFYVCIPRVIMQKNDVESITIFKVK